MGGKSEFVKFFTSGGKIGENDENPTFPPPRPAHSIPSMKLTEDLTCCESIPDWAQAVVGKTTARVVSFGHTVIQQVDWSTARGYLPLHDVLHFAFVDGESPILENNTESHFAEIFQIGRQPQDKSGERKLPSLAVYIEREHFNAVVTEHFASETLPQTQPHTFLRGTPHGRGLYAMAAALWEMVEIRADLFSRYCLELAMIKAIALAPPSMKDLVYKGETWGPMLRRVEAATHFMIQNLEEPFDLAAAAKAAKCSPRTLSGAFQQYLNLPPMKFHLQCRLEAAYAELTRSHASVTEVAMRFGFGNLGRFAKAFRERFGQNPSELRDA